MGGRIPPSTLEFIFGFEKLEKLTALGLCDFKLCAIGQLLAKFHKDLPTRTSDMANASNFF